MASATIEETTHDLFSWDILHTCNGYVQVGNIVIVTGQLQQLVIVRNCNQL